MQKLLLTEDLNADQANLIESVTQDQQYYLSGILMQAAVRNGNGREYDLNEMNSVVTESMKRIQSGHLIMGELNHPNHLQIDLDRVSHAITEMKMDGNNVVGKMRLLNTPCGQTARAIMEGGVRLGVSSRGSGSVEPTGRVKGFQFVTVDIVSTPSAPDAHPNLVREALEDKKIMTLSEAVCHDPAAQKYLRLEIKKFLRNIIDKK